MRGNGREKNEKNSKISFKDLQIEGRRSKKLVVFRGMREKKERQSGKVGERDLIMKREDARVLFFLELTALFSYRLYR